jgi:ABC-type bacteriocin/lantibiotic exporter with double-glycine peptidase domain
MVARRVQSRHVLLHLPPVPQRPSNSECGPAVLHSILSYFHAGGTYRETVKACKPHPAYGTSPERLADVAQRYGLDATIEENLELNEVAEHLQAGRPVITATSLYGGHYVAPVGMTSRTVFLRDPMIDAHLAYLPRWDFLHHWHDTDRHGKVRRRLGIILRHRTRKSLRAVRVP